MLSYLYYLVKREYIKKKFKRVLPFGDYFFSRWSKARFCKFGEGSSVYDSSLILGNVVVGKNSWIGPYTILDGSGEFLIIGNNCNISSGVHIYTHDTVDKVIFGKNISYSSVSIGDNVYIGPNTVIRKGVKIGNNVIIGALSYVNKDIPDWHKAYGAPITIKPIPKNE
jgi:acetyltransferase-like isoleucine patch superfamily enzyme